MESKLTLPILCAYTAVGAKVKYASRLENRKKETTLTVSDLPYLRGQAYLKLLLRPLSSLTDEQIAELDSLHDFSVMNITQIKIAPMRYPYPIVQKLIEWHFDIFGLLESGYALPLNDHEN